MTLTRPQEDEAGELVLEPGPLARLVPILLTGLTIGAAIWLTVHLLGGDPDWWGCLAGGAIVTGAANRRAWARNLAMVAFTAWMFGAWWLYRDTTLLWIAVLWPAGWGLAWVTGRGRRLAARRGA